MEYDSFQVEALIIHEIPRRLRGEEPANPNLSERTSELDDELRVFFRDKLRNSLMQGQEIEEAPLPEPPATTEGQAETEVEPDGGNETSDGSDADPAADELRVPDLVRAELGHEEHDDARFVELSHQLARHLCACQTGAMSEGLLVVMGGRTDAGRALTVVKLQRQEAIQLERENGTFSVKHLQNLMFDSATKVYKAALFGHPVEDVLRGIGSDEQASREHYAAFFLRNFLGCRFQEDASAITLRYFDTAETFMRGRIAAADRTRYLMALIVDMQSQNTRVEPRRFAADHLPTNLVDDFVREVEEQDVPTVRFDKDTSKILGRLQRIHWKMKSGIGVTATTEAYVGGAVHIEKDDEGITTITIRGELDTIDPRKR